MEKNSSLLEVLTINGAFGIGVGSIILGTIEDSLPIYNLGVLLTGGSLVYGFDTIRTYARNKIKNNLPLDHATKFLNRKIF